MVRDGKGNHPERLRLVTSYILKTYIYKSKIEIDNCIYNYLVYSTV